MKLEKIFRQAAESEIIMNAHKINKGEPVTLNKYSKDFLFVRRNSPDAIIAAMCTLLKKNCRLCPRGPQRHTDTDTDEKIRQSAHSG